MNVRRLFVGLTLLVACGGVACIIGPKQDDPLEDRTIEDSGIANDVAASADSGAFTSPDTAVAAQDSAPPPSDTGTPSGDSTASDTAGDSPSADADAGATDASDASDAAETD